MKKNIVIDVKNAQLVDYNNETLCITYKYSSFYYNCIILWKKVGDFVRQKLSNPGVPRTTGPRSQNNCFWGWCTQIGDITGNDKKVMHDYFLSEAVMVGYPQAKNDRGEKLYNIWGQPKGKSTAAATKAEMKIVLNRIKQFAQNYEPPIILKEYEE